MKHIFTLSFFLLFSFSLSANKSKTAKVDTVVVCNNLVQASLDEDCEVLVTADMMTEGTVNDGDFTVTIVNQQNVPVPNPATGAYIGQLLTATVTHNASGNSCWGNLELEDKIDPTVVCLTATIQCFQDPDIVPPPPGFDNCDMPQVNLTNEVIDNSNLCNGVTILRTYVAIDNSGNVSAPCTQTISTAAPAAPTFPGAVTWNCHDVNDYPTITDATPITGNLATTGSGLPDVAVGIYCPYNITDNDVILFSCGDTYKIIRTWTVLNWCTGAIETATQVIDIVDQEAPVITMAPFSVSANVAGDHPEPCNSQGLIPAPAVTDNCSDWTLEIFTPVGEAFYVNGVNGDAGGIIPSPGLEQGVHDIIYQATDECGNTHQEIVQVTVIDDIAPSSVCDEITDVSLSSDGYAEVLAETFDDGSSDNCCLDYFEVAKSVDNCGNPADLDFGPSVTFCCEDAQLNPIMVTFRAYDCEGNYNDCMVEVNVEDKIAPQLINCPPAASIDCDFYFDNLEADIQLGNFDGLNQFGTPLFLDNCEVLFLMATAVNNVNSCGQGTLVRQWTVTDPSNNTPVSCTQTVFVEHVSDWAVSFPDDATVTCTETLPDTGEPVIFYESCELIAATYADQMFNVVQDACFKIIRDWTVINWCVVGPTFDNDVIEDSEVVLNVDLNGDGVLDEMTFQDGLNTGNYNPTNPLNGAQPDGYIVYEQIIKVIDNTAPVLTCQSTMDVCIFESGCGTTVTIPTPEVQDCSDEITITASGDLGIGFGPFLDVAPGIYVMTYQVMDNCGNSNACQITVVVEDCKNPTPYCLNGLIIELDSVSSEVIVWAEDFDAGSFDNCPGDLQLSFSTSTSHTSEVFNCFTLGQNIVELWVTDAAGNQDFCETFVYVQDNMWSCMGLPLIGGTIENENGSGIGEVTVELSGAMTDELITTSTGEYIFDELPDNGDFTVTPVKDMNYLNGVTTFDLVLISKHVLGSQYLDTPYKIIAADANKSGAVTTLDMVAIRKVILFIEDSFPNCDSWRFVDSDFVFADPTNPFANDFPEVIDYNNLMTNETETDFVAIKVGDVNISANPNSFDDSDDRNTTETFEINIKNQDFIAGEIITVPFTAKELAVLGYQFTLEFDDSQLEFIEIEDGIVSTENFGMSLLDRGVLTTSWNQSTLDANNENAVLFSLKFKAHASAMLENVLEINSTYTVAEAYSGSYDLMDVQLSFVNPINSNAAVLFQNKPNPFQKETTISFQLPEATNATLKVYDLSGRVLKLVNGDFEKGLNEVNIQGKDLNATGIIFYQISTADWTATNKMIFSK